MTKARQYIAAFSVGNQCGVAHQLQRRGLRHYAGPIDWFDTTDDKGLEELLANRFAGFFDSNNLEIAGVYKQPAGLKEDHLIIRDTRYGVLSKHDFPCSRNLPGDLADLDAFQNKVQNRVAGFLRSMSEPGPVLFVRRGSGNQEHYLNLYSILTELRGGRPFDLVAVAYRKAFDAIAELKQIQVYREHIPCDENHWRLDDQEWDHFLANAVVTPS